MADQQNIIQSKIVDTEWDAFWQELPANVAMLQPKDSLVLSLPYATSSAEDVQLNKMLQACQLADYNVVQMEAGQKLAWHRLKSKLSPRHILLLGILPEQLGISALFRLFSPNHFDECTWIPGLSLTEMESQPEVKKQLWLNGLKPVFVDKTA